MGIPQAIAGSGPRGWASCSFWPLVFSWTWNHTWSLEDALLCPSLPGSSLVLEMGPGLVWPLCAQGVHTYRSVHDGGGVAQPAVNQLQTTGLQTEQDACSLPLTGIYFLCQTLHHTMFQLEGTL